MSELDGLAGEPIIVLGKAHVIPQVSPGSSLRLPRDFSPVVVIEAAKERSVQSYAKSLQEMLAADERNAGDCRAPYYRRFARSRKGRPRN